MDIAVWIRWIVGLLLVVVAAFALLRTYNAVSYRLRLDAFYGALPDSWDVSEQRLTAPAAAKTLIEALQGEGFERLGEAQSTLPKTGTPLTIWVFTDRDRTTMADVGVQPDSQEDAFSTLASRFPDEAYVFSGFRLSAGALSKPVEDDDFRAHYFSGDPAKAYYHHRKQMARMAVQHGEPVRYESIEQYLEGEKLFKTRYLKRQNAAAMRSIQRRLFAVALVAWFDLAVGVGLYWLIANIRTVARTLPGALLGWLAALVATLLGVASYLVTRRIVRDVPGARRRRRADRK